MGYAYVAKSGTAPKWRFFDDYKDTTHFWANDPNTTLPTIRDGTYGYWSFMQETGDQKLQTAKHIMGQVLPGLREWRLLVWCVELGSCVAFTGASASSGSGYTLLEDPDFPYAAIGLGHYTAAQTYVRFQGFGSEVWTTITAVPSTAIPICVMLKHTVDATNHTFTSYYRVGRIGAWTLIGTQVEPRAGYPAWEGNLWAEMVTKGKTLIGTVTAGFDRWSIAD